MSALFLEFIERVWIERCCSRGLLHLHRLGKIRPLAILLEVRFANDWAPFHRPMVLGARKRVSLVGFRKGCAYGKVFRFTGTQGVSVKTRAAAYPAQPVPSVAQRQS